MAEAEATPSVIVSHVDIVYRVFGSRPPGQRGPRSWFSRSEEARAARTVHAVKDVSFVARHGESIGIIGRNGSGKSTLLRAVAGLMPPSNGEVWADGTPSLLGVNAVLVKQLSGSRNVYIGAQALGLSKNEVDEIYDEIVDFSGVGDAIHLPMSTYSSGMAARLRFAISTAAVPPVLVIDEALATGDAHFRARSQERIESLRDRAGTVFLVSHSASSIRAMCDRAIWLDQGVLVADGPVDEVVDAYQATTSRALGGRAVEPDVPGVERWSGDTRYHTSALTSRRGLDMQTDTVVLASGADLALALACVPPAAAVAAPVLLTHPTRLMPTTRAEIERLDPQRVLLVGGPTIVGPDVAAALDALGVAVDRVGTDDAPGTIVELLGDLDADAGVDTLYLVRDDDPQAALAATILMPPSAVGRILLVGQAGLTDDQIRTVRRIRPRVVRVVADEDVLPASVLADLEGLAREGVERVLSPTPAIAAAEASRANHAPGAGVVYIASSDVTAVGDAVTGSGVAELAEAPLLLVERDEIPAVTRAELERLGPGHLVVLGGPATITSAVRGELAHFLRGSEDADPAVIDSSF